jgi:large subunit ribosomal protein L31e
MAETKAINRTYNIPLRSGFRNKPKHTRAKVCIRVVKDFLKKHMKSEEIKLGKFLNLEIWKHGMRNPPHHIKVNVVKDKEGVVTAELFGHEYVDNKKTEEQESIKDRIMNKVGGPEKTVVKKVKEEVKPAPATKKAPAKEAKADAKPKTE